MSSLYYQEDDDLFLAALASLPGLGPRRLGCLQKQYSRWQDAWEARIGDWQVPGLSANCLSNWQQKKTTFKANGLAHYLQSSQTFLLNSRHKNYPAGFKDLKDAPLLIYARGIWPQAQQKLITVIGSRKPTPYGEAAALEFIQPLSQLNYSIVSGLALGLDALAHRLCLDAQGHTIAILGSGLDNIYPREHWALSKRILDQGGLLISEYSPLSPPLKANFIQRNRLLAAISEATLVLEAQAKSGSIITANLARQLNKKVYAVPGNIFNNQAAGCHDLIRQGAQLASAITDIAPKSILTSLNETNLGNLSSVEKNIISLLKLASPQFNGTRVDEICQQLMLDTSSVNSKLSILEIKKLVCQKQGRYYLLPSVHRAQTNKHKKL